jgi:putative transport protein
MVPMPMLAQIRPGSDAAGLLVLAAAVVSGLAVGTLRIRGIRLGVSGVLFSAMAFSQFHLTPPEVVLGFLRDFSLTILVFSIGLQVGPGFFDSIRAEGLKLNLLAVAVILIGAAFTELIALIPGTALHSSSGIFSGAFTTTTALAAGQEILRQMFANRPGNVAQALAVTGLAYAVTYPFGLVGPSLVIAGLRRALGINIADERAALLAAQNARRPPAGFLDIEITVPQYTAIALRDHPLVRDSPAFFSRLVRDGHMTVPTADTIVQIGDIYRAIGPTSELQKLAEALGRPSSINLDQLVTNIQRMEILVTRPHVLRKSLRDLAIPARTGVTIGRVTRSGVELVPSATLHFKFGDTVLAIGSEEGLKTVAQELGNSRASLEQPRLIPIFLGIALGIIVGSIPIRLPGLNTTLQIGLAGGPMIAAILLSQLGNIGSVVWYMPAASNQLFRDFGLAVFLACVGFQSGDQLLGRLIHGGFVFVVYGALITVIPVFLVGLVARKVYKMNFITLAGWVAGAMTSTPALMFASEFTNSDAPAIAYASVAPLCMLVPILSAQILATLR